jgi:hypothetical protein
MKITFVVTLMLNFSHLACCAVNSETRVPNSSFALQCKKEGSFERFPVLNLSCWHQARNSPPIILVLTG